MYAIVKLGAKQYRVEPETIIKVEKTGKNPGEEFTLDQVLLVGDGSNVDIGQPYVSGKSVKAKVLADIKDKKIDGFIYKRRKSYHKAWGHRQELQKVQILSIG